MTQVQSQADRPQLYLYSDNSFVAQALSQAVAAVGLTPQQRKIEPSPSLTINDLAAWVITDLASAGALVIDALQSPGCHPGKAIVLFSLDKPADSLRELNEWIDKNNGYINKIIEIGHGKQIDLRVLAYPAAYSLNQIGEGSALSQYASELRSGRLPQLSDSQSFRPIHIDQLTASIIAVWFDRGHKSQTILLQGTPLPIEELKSLFTQLPLARTPFPFFWSAGEGIAFDDKIEIKPDKSILFRNLTAQYVPPTTPAESPEPLRPPRTFTNPPIPSTPSNLYEPPEPPASHESSESSASPEPPEPLRTPRTAQIARFVRPPRSPSSWIKYRKYVVIALLSTVIAYAVVAYGLFALSLYRVSRFNPGDGDQLAKFATSLQAAHVRYQKLALIHSLDHLFEHRYVTAQQSLLQQQAWYHGTKAFLMTAGGLEGDPYKEISQAKLLLDQLYELESKTNSEPLVVQRLESLRQILTLYPQLVPENQKITVLILLQNNLELRPTGGFINSVALLTLDHGKILNLDTRNIYDLDSNLRGTVTPPAEITQYLGESSWYFRDSNWNPDFPESAQSANWFLDKEWGSQADLVVGLNTLSFKNLLAAVGSLNLVNGTTVNADNLLISALNNQDSPADAQSQSELLAQIISALNNQINQTTPAVQQRLLGALYTSLANGDITLAVPDSRLSLVLNDLRLSGAVYTPVCAPNLPEPCFADHFYLNEANVGINKANYYLSRQYTHQTTLAAGTIRHTHQLSLQNTSPDGTWPAGSYKAVYRAYLPDSAVDVSVSIGGQSLPAEQLSFLSQPQFRIVSWFYELKPQAATNLVISYHVPLENTLKSYQLFVQKQPGILSTNFSFNFSGQNLPDTVETDFTGHRIFPIKFSP